MVMIEIDDLLKPLQDDEEKAKEILLEDFKITITSYTEEFLFKTVKSYTDVCQLLQESFQSDPYLQLKQIAKLFNGEWKPVFNHTQQNWYPYFQYRPGEGLVYDMALHDDNDFLTVAFYYKTERISNYVGKTFVNVYNNLSESY
jgi:hypothetical protein